MHSAHAVTFLSQWLADTAVTHSTPQGMFERRMVVLQNKFNMPLGDAEFDLLEEITLGETGFHTVNRHTSDTDVIVFKFATRDMTDEQVAELLEVLQWAADQVEIEGPSVLTEAIPREAMVSL